MTQIQLRFGSQTLTAKQVHGEMSFMIAPVEAENDSKQFEKDPFTRALEKPIGSARLREIATGKKSAAILIPGKTRIAATSRYVPALVDELNQAGIQDRDITIFLATGTHEHHIECDFKSLVGEEIGNRVNLVAHDCHDGANTRYLGTTSYRTPVYINKQVLSCDVIIPTGRIVPHYFAGFTGGRKALIPGVAGFETIKANHRLTLDAGGGLNPRAGCCLTDENPVHLDMMEGAAFVNPAFMLNTVMDHKGSVVSVVAGDWIAAHREGCKTSQALFNFSLDAPVDALITGAGGSPYDCNFMQSLKALFNVQKVVKRGGHVLWIAECTFGIQPEFLSWCSIGNLVDLRQAVHERYDLKGHNSVMLRSVLSELNVALFSKLPPDTVSALGMHPVSSLEQGVEWLNRNCGRNFSYAVAPYANVISAHVAARTAQEVASSGR
jgi:nickel-dependent lactate racemase